jgi:hypothetical protein
LLQKSNFKVNTYKCFLAEEDKLVVSTLIYWGPKAPKSKQAELLGMLLARPHTHKDGDGAFLPLIPMESHQRYLLHARKKGAGIQHSNSLK